MGIIDTTEWFVHRHGGFLRDFVERHIPEADVDDVVQQIFVVAWRRSAEQGAILDASLEQQRAWLYQTARFHVWTHHRTAQRRRKLAECLHEQSQTLLSAHPLDPRTLDVLHRSIQRLPRKEWEILEARHYDRMSTSEIALWLGITDEAARQRLKRALDKLRILFGREVDR